MSSFIRNETVVFKHMESGEQAEVARSEAGAWLMKRLGGESVE